MMPWERRWRWRYATPALCWLYHQELWSPTDPLTPTTTSTSTTTWEKSKGGAGRRRDMAAWWSSLVLTLGRNHGFQAARPPEQMQGGCQIP